MKQEALENDYYDLRMAMAYIQGVSSVVPDDRYNCHLNLIHIHERAKQVLENLETRK